MCCCRITRSRFSAYTLPWAADCSKIFQPLLPVSTDTVSEIEDLTKLVFRIGIAVLRCHMEAADGLLHILPAFFLEVDLTGKIGRRM